MGNAEAWDPTGLLPRGYVESFQCRKRLETTGAPRLAARTRILSLFERIMATATVHLSRFYSIEHAHSSCEICAAIRRLPIRDPEAAHGMFVCKERRPLPGEGTEDAHEG